MKSILTLSILVAVASLFSPTARADQNTDAIIQATMRFVFQEAAVNDPSVTIEKVEGSYARVGVISLSGTTDPVKAFLKGGNGQWKVLTLGTNFTAADLADYGIPASLAN